MDNYREFFSQGSSSQGTRSFLPSQDAGDEYDFGPFTSQPPHSLSVPRRHMENLDLNSQGDVFPSLDSYQEFLQAGDDGVNYPLPPRAPAGRGLGRGGARGGRRARSAGGRVQGHAGAVGSRGGRGGTCGGGRVGGRGGGHNFDHPQEIGTGEDEDEDSQ